MYVKVKNNMYVLDVCMHACMNEWIYFCSEKAVEDDTTSKSLASAPKTILTGDELPDIQTLDLLFKPTMGQVNMLALPENLPLDFIASK